MIRIPDKTNIPVMNRTYYFNRKIIGIILFVTTTLSAQNIKEKPYRGLITEDDPRVVDIIRNIEKNLPPEKSYRLRFSRIEEWIFLVFYDLDGREIFYKFRDSRWDDRPMKVASTLFEGRAYQVQGEWIGIYFQGRFYNQSSKRFSELVSQLARNNNIIPVFSFDSVHPLILDKIKL